MALSGASGNKGELMGLTILDFVLFGIMAISGLLALMRGFTREVLSLVAWGLAALAAYFAIQQQDLVNILLPYLDKESFAKAGVGLIAFLLTLIVVSIISVKISDAVVDSSAGAFDRTLGLGYGLLRGLVLVGLGYLIYGWLQPPDRQEEWVKNAKSLGAIQYTSDTLRGFMPPDIAETLSANTGLGSAVPDAPPAAETTPDAPAPANDQQGLENLSNGAAETPASPPTQAPAEAPAQ